MVIFLQLAACVWIAGGVLAWTISQSVMHETLALTALSFGVVFLALAAILERLRNDSGPIRVQDGRIV